MHQMGNQLTAASRVHNRNIEDCPFNLAQCGKASSLPKSGRLLPGSKVRIAWKRAATGEQHVDIAAADGPIALGLIYNPDRSEWGSS